MLTKWAPRRHASRRFHTERSPLLSGGQHLQHLKKVVSMQGHAVVHCEGSRPVPVAHVPGDKEVRKDRIITTR